jgi:RNA polymerase sigma factor (TIGR02999 family)
MGAVPDVTRILSAIEQGDSQAAEQLLPLVYAELRRLAAHKMAGERPGQTLQATALVHEAYLRLVGAQNAHKWNDSEHFFAVAAEAMRRILIEKARRNLRVRHGGGHKKLDLNELDLADQAPAENVLALNDALETLAAEEPVVADVVKLRYFAGLTLQEVANALDLSLRTANRHWAYAKAWLYDKLSEPGDADE